MFTQGSYLMAQGDKELAAHVLLDLSVDGTVVSLAEDEDRRFVFLVRCPAAQAGAKAVEHRLQALNAQDLMEWIVVMNNLLPESSQKVQIAAKPAPPSANVASAEEAQPPPGSNWNHCYCVIVTETDGQIYGCLLVVS